MLSGSTQTKTNTTMDEEGPLDLDLRHEQEHRDIEEQITLLEETMRQHFENEALLFDLRSIVGPDSQEKIDEIIAAHKKSHQGLLEALESIANEFRDHMLLEELYKDKDKDKDKD